MSGMHPLLRPAPYEVMRDEFRWDIPARLNMAAQVCDDWAEAVPAAAPTAAVAEKVRRGTVADGGPAGRTARRVGGCEFMLHSVTL